MKDFNYYGLLIEKKSKKDISKKGRKERIKNMNMKDKLNPI